MLDFIVDLILTPAFTLILVMGFVVAGLVHYYAPQLPTELKALAAIATWGAAFTLWHAYDAKNGSRE